MKEPNGFTPFNHDYLCQMLRSASDNELANIFNDVAKEQQRRDAAKKELYTTKIHDTIREAIKAGFEIYFFTDTNSGCPDFTIHSNNEMLLDIELEKE